MSMFRNLGNLKLFVLLTYIIIAAATMITDFGGPPEQQHGVKGSIIVTCGAILVVAAIVRVPTKKDSESDRIAFMAQLSIASSVFLGGLYWFLAETASNPEFRLVAVVPNIGSCSNSHSV